jgi:hypothetical protein
MSILENDRYQETIRQYREGVHQLNLQTARIARQLRQNRQGMSAELRLLADTFEQETGLDIKSPEGAAAFTATMALHIQRAEQHKEAREERQFFRSFGISFPDDDEPSDLEF